MSTAVNLGMPDPQVPAPPIELIDSDGVPLETFWHNLQIGLLIELTRTYLRGRDDFFAGGNMFLYYSLEQARNRDYKGPDFFFVKDVDGRKMRRWWAIWQEGGRFPNVIIELLSPTTSDLDRGSKKDLYERVFQTPEYFCYDPDERRLEGWRLTNGSYQPIQPQEHGRLESEQLGLSIGEWTGTRFEIPGVWLRFYDRAGTLVPTEGEAEHQRAEVERRRREELEAELAQLRGRPADGKTEGEA